MGKQNLGSPITKLNKRVIDSLLPRPDRDAFVWDGEVRGFGLRLKPSGVKTYFIQYRSADGRTRRMVIGKHGILTTEQARDLARKQLTEVLNGEDPSAKRRAARSGLTVSDICNWYLTEARAGRLLGRNRRPIKASTLDGDEGRINVHIKPLIGAQLVRGIILVDVEKFQAKIASGRPTTGTKRRHRGGQTKGGAGVASRTVSTLRSMLGHAKRYGLIETNPALGIRVIAGNKKLRRLSREELGRLGATMAMMEEQGEHPTGLAAIRAMLLTGFRKMEVLGMHRAWIDVAQQTVCFPDSKSGQQIRVIGRSAVDLLLGQPKRDGLAFIFPADWGDGHFVGVVRVLDRICARAGIRDITPPCLETHVCERCS